MNEGRFFRISFQQLENDKATAPELAQELGVSVRTIYRDIDVMSISGIPIYMQGGRNGGICLSEGYQLNKIALSDEEKAEVLLVYRGWELFNIRMLIQSFSS